MFSPLRIALIMILIPLCGCVQRSLTVACNDAGGAAPYTVYIDGMKAGETPYTAGFVSYGVREVTLEDGYGRTQTEKIFLKRPWYQYFPVDFFAELLFPGTITSEFVFSIGPPQELPIDLDSIESRASEFKRQFKARNDGNK